MFKSETCQTAAWLESTPKLSISNTWRFYPLITRMMQKANWVINKKEKTHCIFSFLCTNISMFESDSTQIAQAMQSFPRMTVWHINNIISDIGHQLDQLQSWRFHHVYPSGNSIVHHLARWAASKIALGDYAWVRGSNMSIPVEIQLCTIWLVEPLLRLHLEATPLLLSAFQVCFGCTRELISHGHFLFSIVTLSLFP